MNNFLGFSIVVGISYFAFQIYRKIKAAIELDKTLPQYLENLLGEKPTSFNVNLEFSGTSIEIVFSQRIIDENENIEQIVRDYLKDFYPMFKVEKLKIKISAMSEKN
jgi:hypothetical protein